MSLKLLGNDELLNNIKVAAARNRLPHAIIIEGEKGSGRKTLAKFISAALLCESENAPCGNCRVCDLVSKNGHTDISIFEPDGATFKVAQVRDIREKAFIMPLEAKRKIFVLCGADTMNKQSQNALLKTIEEPPSFLTFILICENSEALLPTVISRCVKFRLSLPNISDGANYLVELGHERAEAQKALEISGGNVGKALDIIKNTVPPTLAAARELLEIFEERRRVDGLLLLHKFEKKREDAVNLLTEFKALSFKKLKEACFKNGNDRAATLYKNCVEISDSYIKKLKQNGNISLLTTSLCAEIFALFDR